ncbi:MAG: translation elongation factor Ts [Dehalococcoidia bacterium]|nr:translation elongation factor Ts [Dehalococcoidia bacterium]|tara:strand:- start:73 stop:567 length:495 start_codon:yes stop_codon:yes gene_type:complete
MAEITAKQIKELRDSTGAGIMDAKKALEESDGNIEKAVEILDAKGLASAEKRSGRATENGIIESYIHTGGRIGSLVQLSCETDFVARTDDFVKCAKEIAMQIAAMNPKAISKEENSEFSDDEILESQAYIRDASKSVGEVVKELSAKVGENVVIQKIHRFEIGS